MALTPRLDLRQTQALVMTPQLQQAIKLLQFSNIELATYVEQELERNPLLTREDGQFEDSSEPAESEEDPPQADGNASPGPDEELPALDLSREGEEGAAPAQEALDLDYDNTWNNDSASDQSAFSSWGSGGRTDFSDPTGALEQTLSGEVGLRDHLLSQINVDFSDPTRRLIAARLVDHLDEAGYFIGDVEEICDSLGCSSGQIEEILPRLQNLDPTGIFARNLGECLAIQLRERDRFDPAMETLIDNLDLLARHEHQKLIKLCGVDAEDMADMIAEIRALDPKPAHAFDAAPMQPVVPDVLMRPGPGGDWIVELNSETLPKVIVNNAYHAQVSAQIRGQDDRRFVAECLQTANWLVKSLHQRATTILKVASEIIRQQDAFFTYGIGHLKPLVLRDIAEEIDMHESTVSRVTSNKFMATPRGLFELKYFFSASLGDAKGGAAHSAESVRHRIKTLIDAEAPEKILSDDKIVDILNGEGIDIARRTVAKYREALKIPSSVQRRRQKRGALDLPLNAD